MLTVHKFALLSITIQQVRLVKPTVHNPDPNILKSITVCVQIYKIDIILQVACKHFKDEIGNDPIVFLDSNRKETTHF